MDLTWAFVITALYFVFILTFVVYARYKATKSFFPEIGEFFLAGKSLGPLILTCTYVASLFSTFSILGLPGFVYAHGLSALFFLGLAYIPGFAILYFVGRFIYRVGQKHPIFSPVEAVSIRYGSRLVGLYISAVFVIALLPYISMQLVGIGAFIESYSEGRITYTTGVGAMMIVVLLYLFLGGMRAVAYTDFIQLAAMAVSTIFGAIFIMNYFDISLPALFSEAHENEPRILTAPGAKDFFHWPMILSMAIVTSGVFIQPQSLTRTLMAKEEKHINMIMLGTLIGMVITFSLGIFFGLYALNTFGSELAPNNVMGEIFKGISGINVLGMILAALMLIGALGAAMSTADSLLISIGQITIRDIVRPFIRFDRPKQVFISKCVMVLILGLAFAIGLNPPKYLVDLGIYSTAIASLMIPIFISMNWSKRSPLAAYTSLTLGVMSFAALFILKITDIYSIQSVHIGFLPLVLSFIGYYGVALLSARRTPEGQLSPAQE